MEAARCGDSIAHSSALGGFITGMVAGAVIGAALVLTVATGGIAAPLLVGAVLVGAALGAWVGEFFGSLSLFNSNTGNLTGFSPFSNVFINGLHAMRAAMDVGICSKERPLQRIAQGSVRVFINGFPGARNDDKLECGAIITSGSSNVNIGGGKGDYLAIKDGVPSPLRYTVLAAGLTGAVLLGGVAIIPELIGGMVLSAVGGHYLGLFARQHGEWVNLNIGGLPSDWEKSGRFIGEVGGGFGGAKIGRGIRHNAILKFKANYEITPRAEQASATVRAAMEKTGVGKRKSVAYGVRVDKNGEIHVAFSGEEAKVNTIWQKVRTELPENYKLAPTISTKLNLRTYRIKFERIKGKDTCVEPKLAEIAQGDFKTTLVAWYGKPGTNRHPMRGYPNYMKPCKSCATNQLVFFGLEHLNRTGKFLLPSPYLHPLVYDFFAPLNDLAIDEQKQEGSREPCQFCGEH